MKTCRYRGQRQTTDSIGGGCIFAHKGAREVSYPEVHGLAAVWRSLLKDLS